MRTPDHLMTRIGTLITVTDSDDGTDPYGNPEPVEQETTVRYELQQVRRSETADPDAWQVDLWKLYVPAGTTVTGWDRFVDDQGAEYAFVGTPERKWNPRARAYSHVEATLRRAT